MSATQPPHDARAGKGSGTQVESRHASQLPSSWIARFASLIPHDAHVLDVAAGRGRHARFLASRGARVVAVDRDGDALANLHGVANVETHVADLEAGAWPFGSTKFEAIVVVHYLHRPLFAALLDALRADGVLLYDTFAAGNERFGRPANPAFLLAPGELLERVGTRLTVVAFEQGLVDDEAGRRVVQRIAAVGRARPWPPPLAPSL